MTMKGAAVMQELAQIDETCLDAFRAGYLDTFAVYHAAKFRWSVSFTQRATRDAIRFLRLCAVPPAGQEGDSFTESMVCSPVVDKIVDAIFLDSPLLLWLERNVFGGVRVLHVPYYAHGDTNAAINNARYAFTVAMMRAAGYPVAPTLWPPRLPAGYLTCTASNDLEDCQFRAVQD